MDIELPVACTLTDSELRDRRRTILDSMRRVVLDITPLTDGYAYSFAPTSENLSQLAHFIGLEPVLRVPDVPDYGRGREADLFGNHRAT